MGAITELAERAWQGDASLPPIHPSAAFLGLEPLTDDLAFVLSFGNVIVVTTGEGLLLVDTSGPFHAQQVFDAVRATSQEPVATAIFTHGHIDHVFGILPFDAEATRSRRPLPHVVAHANVPARFARYTLTATWNGRINQRQFGLPSPVFPTTFRAPDRVYQGRLDLNVGGVAVELHHDRGETDDHTWVWLPSMRALCTGDLFVWASPNCGNPQKVQRYPREWAAALRKMDALEAEMLLPGHGPPIVGGLRVRAALRDTAVYLEGLTEQTLRLMNDGAALDEILHTVRPDATLLARPYLRPLYDDPEFVVRTIWRQYGGWWDGNPARLKPARDLVVARAVVELAGGLEPLVARAERAATDGDLRLAAHLVEMAFLAAPDSDRANDARAGIYARRVQEETSLMAKAIFRGAVKESGG